MLEMITGVEQTVDRLRVDAASARLCFCGRVEPRESDDMRQYLLAPADAIDVVRAIAARFRFLVVADHVQGIEGGRFAFFER
jgi:hypothetical protein